ncbi:MAG: hypothetical protein HQ581_00185 [Planctomycetes bacterium]|nr:hypothetical protein [Planctomycetota bacterium]
MKPETRVMHSVLWCLPALTLLTVASAAEPEPIHVSGRYPHLAMFNHQGECGTGAVVAWADRLWAITYGPHLPDGSDDKLYEIDAALNRTTRPESVGGTPANRMIHRESNQLNIGPYFIDAQRNVRVVPPSKMYGRLTATARHLTDPAEKVYVCDMEGLIYEVDVRSLDVNLLFKRPIPGWHAKGGYSGQGRLVVANNGEHGAGSVNQYKPFDYFVDPTPTSPEDAGALGQWDGKTWSLVERRQFTDVTGPGGILGPPDDDAPLWAIGWDRRSLLLKLCDEGRWSTFRLPVADYSYFGKHGWHTEWPRIREVTGGRYLMNLHGGWFDFPGTFSAAATGGLRPLGAYAKVTADFCAFDDRIVFGCDDTAKSGFSRAGVGDTLNRFNGQSCSNLWFTTWEKLSQAGRPAGFGGPWLGDDVEAGVPSDPFLLAGFEQRCLHLAVGTSVGETSGIKRTSEKFEVTRLPRKLAGLAHVTVRRGDFHDPVPAYSFAVDRDVVVYLSVDERGDPRPGDGWRKTEMKLEWGGTYTDSVYVKEFGKGRVDVPGNDVEHTPGAFGMPHLCFVEPVDGDASDLRITDLPKDLAAQIGRPRPVPKAPPEGPVSFTLEIDRTGDGTWSEYKTIAMPESEYAYHVFPEDLDAAWIRLKADRDVSGVTAYFHFGPGGGAVTDRDMFAALADVDEPGPWTSAVVRSEGNDRITLGVLARQVDASGKPGKGQTYHLGPDMKFQATDSQSESARFLREEVATVEQVIQIDDASVIVTEGNLRVRLPKSHMAYDAAWATGCPRALREVVTERSLLNAAGSFYILPRSNSGGLRRIKPLATHNKRITDFCSWRGMLVLAGCKASAEPNGHYFASDDGNAGLWFGDIDDLWKLGKPRGEGGPWRDAAIKAGDPSDPYLMAGYDRKTVALSHDAKDDVHFTLQVDPAANNTWLPYATIRVPGGETVTHTFPNGFGAHWVRVQADRDCRATAWFVYE